MRPGILIVPGMLLMAAPPAVAGERMRGFEEVAARSERLDLTGISGWYKGKFRLGDAGAGGRYEILSKEGRGDGETARFGGSSFTLSGPGIDGEYAGRCGFEVVNAEDRLRSGKLRLTFSTTVVPLSYRCAFEHNRQPIGTLDLSAVASTGISVKEERAGTASFGHRILDISSVHYFERGRLPGASPLGYVLAENGRTIGAADLNGGRKRLALPQDAGLREAALLSSVALALFQDPGDG